jgi:hypothetical protein
VKVCYRPLAEEYWAQPDALTAATDGNESTMSPPIVGGRQLISVANLTRRDALGFVTQVPRIGTTTHTRRYTLTQTN